MEQSRWDRLQELFERGRALEAPRRDAFLREACGDDPGLAAEVRELLEEHTSTIHGESDGSWTRRDEPEDLSGRRFGQYRLLRKIGQGAMGVLYEASQDWVRRSVALKLLRPREEIVRAGGSPGAWDRMARRFTEEAEILGRLDHPGIVPIHEMAGESDERRWFTMRLVEGEDFQRAIAAVRSGKDGWSLTRALGVVLRVAETMAFAHARGVLHRDLKPSHVLVGRYGQVYIVDWGLAKVKGGPELKDIRLREEGGVGAGDASPLRTVDGDVIGTPAYMPPEQARGRLELLGEHSDVYAVGAILYHLLTGRVPYLAEDETRLPHHVVLERVRQGPPTPIAELAPGTPPELVAIAEKAMAPQVRGRYATMEELAHDLSAYLEDRVVRAYRTGPVIELRQWYRRNRAMARTASGAIGVLLLGLTATSAVLADRNTALSAARDEAVTNERDAVEKRDQLLRLSDEKRLRFLQERADDMWPRNPDLIPEYEAWLDEARALVARRPLHQQALEELERRAVVYEGDALDDLPEDYEERWQLDALREGLRNARDSGHIYREHIGEGSPVESIPDIPSQRQRKLRLRAQLEALAADRESPVFASVEESLATWQAKVFDENEDRWWHENLTGLLEGIDELADPDLGLIHDIEQRIEFARDIGERSLTGADAQARWSEAIASIADTEACPVYGGLEIVPQVGLLPIWCDPSTGLWEFAHLATGEVPGVDEDTGSLDYREEHGVVLVLLPGGRVPMGQQGYDAEGRHFVEGLENMAATPVHEVELAPFFLSKYEMTQAQWRRYTGGNPSHYNPYRYNLPEHRISELCPVDSLSWLAARPVLLQMGLELPTEAQWEYGCRAGTTTPWWTGEDHGSLHGAANLGDRSAVRAGMTWSSSIELVDFDDGYPFSAPVDRFAPNPFGLHNVHGNVRELVLDSYSDYAYPAWPWDGMRFFDGTDVTTTRGGSFDGGVLPSQSGWRMQIDWDLVHRSVGLRPSRLLADDGEPRSRMAGPPLRPRRRPGGAGTMETGYQKWQR